MPRLAVLGHPVSHSRSPAMHNAALAELGMDDEWRYEAIDVAPEEFDELVRSLPAQGFVGTSVTVPHKLAALAIADVRSPAAEAIGAANTLHFREGRIECHNTDPNGVLDALPRPAAGLRALVLGAGGSARAAVWGLREAGAQVAIWNRTAAKAEDLAAEFGVEAIDAEAARAGAWGLVVNTTTVGMRAAAGAPEADDPLTALPLDLGALGPERIVVDLVYGQRETPLAAAARAAGASVIDGLEVLVRQGVPQFELWTGRDAPVDRMRAAALAAA